MSNIPGNYTISGYVERDPQLHVITARFERLPDAPTETYTIPIHNFSIEIGAHFPVDIVAVRWVETSEIGGETIIDDLFGRGLSEAFSQSVTEELLAISLDLSPEHRANIVKRQAQSSATPDSLRELCMQMLDELERETEEA